MLAGDDAVRNKAAAALVTVDDHVNIQGYGADFFEDLVERARGGGRVASRRHYTNHKRQFRHQCHLPSRVMKRITHTLALS